MDNQIINCRCGRERRNKESNWSGLTSIKFSIVLQLYSSVVHWSHDCHVTDS